MILNSSSRLTAACAFVMPAKYPRSPPGSLTIGAKMTARAAASGRRAHHRCSVLGWPWRIDFSRAQAMLMASSGRATSMSFLGDLTSSVYLTPSRR